jgi:dTMP kinase
MSSTSSAARAKTGVFVTIEGGEGAGKGSASPILAATLRRAGYEVVETREPGGTAESQAIRALVVERRERDWTPLAELLLLMAARAEHVERLIRPALEAGQAVLCDRFEASTYAYQSAGKGLAPELVRQLQSLVAPSLIPDFTLLFDVDPASGLARSARRLTAAGSNEDRFERLDLGFHQRVRASFLEQARAAPNRWIVIDANRRLELALTEASAELERRLGSQA